MKAKALASAVVTLALWALAAGSVVGRTYVEWQWWDFVTILSSTALTLALILNVAKATWAAAQ